MEGVAGNPWFVTSLWLTQYKIATASSLSDLEGVIKDLEWVASLAYHSMLPEQVHPMTGSNLSATPLVWSHAEYVRTVVEYHKKLATLQSK